MTDAPTIIKIPTLPSAAERATWTDCHIVTTCAVLHIAGLDPDSDKGVCVGHCPACHQAVFEADDPVWTCPANLQEDNPHHEDPLTDITEEMHERYGVFSLCGDDFGRECYEPMPLHGECYDSTTLTY